MSLLILSGEREAGKTTFCRRISRKARQKGMTLTGLITLTDRDRQLTALDLYTGKEMTLAEPNPLWYKLNRPSSLPDSPLQTDSSPMPGSAPRTGRWIFKEETFLWGNNALKKPEPADLFILDEAGILELERNQGWVEGIKRIDRLIDRRIIVVVRPELTAKALKRWPGASLHRINAGNRYQEEKLIERILQSP